MPQVSLSTFVDYVASTGTTRLAKVRAAKQQYARDYQPALDYYGPLRRRVVQVFQEGWDPQRFDELLNDVTDPKKQANYANCRRGLRRWAGVSGRKAFVWNPPRRATWRSGGLEVAINPELWVDIDGIGHVVKLYFKADRLSQHKVTLSLRLLENTVGRFGAVGILDVQQGKLFVQRAEPPAGIDLLLESEATSLALLWEGLED